MTPDELVQWLLKSTFLDPLWDASFKLLIADPAHPQRLTHFLNSLLRLEGNEAIVSTQLKVNEHPSPFGYEKGISFDIHCANQKGEPIIIEMQRNGSSLFKDRMLYYASAVIRKALQSGATTYALPKIYVLSIMNFTFQTENTGYYHTVQLVERENNTLFHDKITFVYIELPHYNEQEHRPTTFEEKWLYALKRMGELKEAPPELDDPIYQDLFQSAKICNFASDTLLAVASNMKDEALYNDNMTCAKQQARTEGLAEGIAEGQSAKTLETIQRMLAKEYPWSEITDITGVTEAEYPAFLQQVKIHLSSPGQ